MRASAAVLAALLLTAAGCGGGLEAEPGQPPTPVPAASRLPDGTPLLIASGTILDSGKGSELCLGAVATSLPPQCGGPRLRGWTWPEDGVTRQSGVTWGAFAVVGTYANGDFTVVKRVSEAEAKRSIPTRPDPDLTSACPEPAGGWRAQDSIRATQTTRDQAFALATELPGYGGAWLDDHGDQGQDPRTSTVNVLVTQDRAGAEQRLRAVWGGPLCVAEAAHTEKELMAILEKLVERPDFLGGGPSVTARGSFVELEVIYDDGALQLELDERYGAGTVVVTSALHPYPG